MRYAISGIMLLLYLLPMHSYAQEVPAAVPPGKFQDLSAGFLNGVQSKAAALNERLATRTKKYLARLIRSEAILQSKIASTDPEGARSLFNHSAERYGSLGQQISKDSGSSSRAITGEYQPHMDSLRGALSFLQQNQAWVHSAALPSAVGTAASKVPQSLQGAVASVQTFEARMQDANQIKAYIQERKAAIGSYLNQHAAIKGLSSQYKSMSQDLYYYSQQVRQYKELFDQPGRLEQKAMALLSQSVSYQSFMVTHSQLSGLYTLPSTYGSSQGVEGLQTKEMVAAHIQGQIAAGGPGGAAALQSNLQSAEAHLNNFKNKLSQLGAGSGDIQAPDFKPNDQKVKSLWKRLEYGFNFQTSRTNYYFPNVADLGVSLGYKVSDRLTAGAGASYKLGIGNGWNNIAFSSQGVGLRSFTAMQVKGSISVRAGLEYNYETPFTSLQQINHLSYWTRSGLVGIAKTVAMKSRLLKKTEVQLLWDFLSYQQVPKTQSILFRVGYSF